MSLFCQTSVAADSSYIKKLKSHYQQVEQLSRLAYKVEFHSNAPHQSYDFRKPDTIVNHYSIEIDRDRNQYFEHFKRHNPGNFVFEFISVINKQQAFRYDVNGFVYGKELRAYTNTMADEYEAISEQINLFAAYEFLHKKKSPIRELHIGNSVSLSYQDTNQHTVSLLFDKNSMQLTEIVNTEDDSKYVFSEPRPIDGMNYASQVKVYNQGKYRHTIAIQSLHRISRIDPKKLTKPTGYEFIESDKNKTLALSKIHKDIFLVKDLQGSRNVMVQKHITGLTVFGAPLSDKASEQVLALIDEKFNNLPVTHVYISHAHGDHIAGLAPYVNRGATIIADDHTIEAIKSFPKFTNNISNLKFKKIKSNEVFQGNRYYVLENTHVRKQSFVYFSDAKTIYQGDFLEIPRDNSIASHMSDVERVFIEFLMDKKIQYNRIVGHHRNSDIRPNIVKAYYNNNI
ncbi:hypothetical protein AT705_24170 [Pseudoalteromonas rubra]|uniref:Metallo-beta-lactamase domain-containing protein n=2 Tax=Pseudoalteromonas rubra TaxID=43658 RepID=A0A0U2Y791_9GAMM|nr:hypothetical protein AT705_24170 [Pseudoalteromonas rubra]